MYHNQQNKTDLSQSRRDVLLNESTYFLNKSKSKWISVGFSLEKKPTIKIAGQKKNQYVIFNEEQWISFLNSEGIMQSFIFYNYEWQPRLENGFFIHFLNIGDTRVIKITQENGNEVFLASDTLNQIVGLQHIVKYRLEILKSYDFLNYYSVLISGLSSKSGDIIKNVYDVISPLKNSVNVCSVLELLHFYPDCIIEDVESYSCNQFVKNCIEKKN